MRHYGVFMTMDVARFSPEGMERVACGYSLGERIPKGPFWLLLSSRGIESLRDEIILGDVLTGKEIPAMRLVDVASRAFICVLEGEIIPGRQFVEALLGERGVTFGIGVLTHLRGPRWSKQ